MGIAIPKKSNQDPARFSKTEMAEYIVAALHNLNKLPVETDRELWKTVKSLAGRKKDNLESPFKNALDVLRQKRDHDLPPGRDGEIDILVKDKEYLNIRGEVHQVQVQSSAGHIYAQLTPVESPTEVYAIHVYLPRVADEVAIQVVDRGHYGTFYIKTSYSLVKKG